MTDEILTEETTVEVPETPVEAPVAEAEVPAVEGRRYAVLWLLRHDDGSRYLPVPPAPGRQL